MRHLRLALTGLALAAAGSASDAAPDAEAAMRTRVQQLVEMMATGDESSRASAADELARIGRPAVAQVGRFAYLIRDAAGRDAVVDALTRIGVDDSIALLVGNPTVSASKGEAPVRELVAALRALRDPKLAVVVELTPAVAGSAARVPPDAEIEIGDELPSALAWGEFAVRRGKGSLQVDVEGGGARFENVEADRPRAVRVGPRKRPILVSWRLDRWYAASGSVLAGKFRGEDVELWDADLDGAFTGPRDRVRFGDGAYQGFEEGGLVLAGGAPMTVSVRSTPDGAAMTLLPEPLPPDVGDWTLKTLAVVNEWRRSVALPPVLLNLPRCAAAYRHVEYWKLNGYSGHDEVAEKPGFTAEGAQAGRKSSVWDTSDAMKLARVITATVLHRASCLGAAAEGEAIAIGSGTCIWGGELDAGRRGSPVLVPGPGQDAVPVACEAETPPPERDANFYGQARGYPVAVVWRGLWTDVKDAKVELFATGPGGAAEPVAGDLFSPEKPYTGKGRPIETSASTFVAAKPLDHRRSYVARFRAVRDAGAVEFSWSFTTR